MPKASEKTVKAIVESTDKLFGFEDDGTNRVFNVETLKTFVFEDRLNLVVVASENLTAGNFVNLYNNSGTLNMRKADATDNTKSAIGYVLTNITSGNSGVVYFSGINNQLSGLTIGFAYLSTTPGEVTSTKPNSSGNIQQKLGFVLNATSMIFNQNYDYIEVT